MNILLPTALFCAFSLSATAAAPSIAVADFDFVDTSGEPRDQVAQHDGRMKALSTGIIHRIGAGNHFAAGPLLCGLPRCSADSLDQASIAAAARTQKARYVVFGGVHKVSTLIQFGQVEVMDVATGRSVLSRAITFRGDDQSAWQHAGDFISQMLIDALAKG